MDRPSNGSCHGISAQLPVGALMMFSRILCGSVSPKLGMVQPSTFDIHHFCSTPVWYVAMTELISMLRPLNPTMICGTGPLLRRNNPITPNPITAANGQR